MFNKFTIDFIFDIIIYNAYYMGVKMKILVVGSKRHISGNQSLFDEVCYNLGSKFAKNGYILIICSNSYHTADPYIAKGFTSEKVKSMIEIFIPNIVEPSEFEKVYMNRNNFV